MVLANVILRRPLWLALACLVSVFIAELLAILFLNQGHFTFSLDDAYIHLAQAENLLDWHYGVNLSEFSAPSSSIVWPFIVAPFAKFLFAPYLVLLLNIIASVGTLALLCKMWSPEDYSFERGKRLTLLLLLIASIPMTNLVGLAYTGMEHSFQLLFSILIVFGLIHEIQHKEVTWWLLVAIVVAPLIRYECLALSAPSLMFLVLRGYRTQALITGTILTALLVGFSIFLLEIGLNPFPTSIMAKSSVVSSGGGINTILSNLNRSLSSPKGILLLMGMSYMLFVTLNKTKDCGVRILALAILLACGLHVLVGRYGWFNRYEVYIWVSLLSSIIYLNKEYIYVLANKLGKLRTTIFVSFFTMATSASYIVTTLATPLAAKNIYEQQYQMHRFITEFYSLPVAVNDLGYAAYHNNEYVLDLWGLASSEALNLRTSSNQSTWMDKIAKRKNVGVAMLYEDWFEKIPPNWIKLGVLSLSGRKVSVSRAEVAFYLTDCKYRDKVLNALTTFSTTLPSGVKFSSQPFDCMTK